MIYITGDTHGPCAHGYFSVDGYSSRFNSNNFPEQREMTRSDHVIICGDFGGVWNYDSRYNDTMCSFTKKECLAHGESKEEKYWLDWLEKKNFTVLFCDGNHESFDRLEKAYEEVDFHGGRAHKIRENVYHLMRGYVFDIDGCSIFVFGGARSHDIKDGIIKPCEFDSGEDFLKTCRTYDRMGLLTRIDHISWWDREMPSAEEMERGLKELEKHGNRVDYIVSHCGPQDVVSAAGFTDSDPLTLYFNTIAKDTDFKKWFFGHYHDNRQIMSRWVMLYEQVVRIW